VAKGDQIKSNNHPISCEVELFGNSCYGFILEDVCYIFWGERLDIGHIEGAMGRCGLNFCRTIYTSICIHSQFMPWL
jgi:hypothetical protein